MKWVAAILLVLTLQAEPTITAWWEGNSLRVIWAAPQPACVYLDDTWVTCNPSGTTLLSAAGVDQAYSPLTHTHLVLKNHNSQVIATLAIPLKPDRYKVILPIVVQLVLAAPQG